MTPETLEALKASIAKWEKNARVRKFENAKIEPSDCALCTLFWEKGCRGCPVRKKTGLRSCEGSPYISAAEVWSSWELARTSSANAKAFRAAAREEVKFLKSLLPEDAS